MLPFLADLVNHYKGPKLSIMVAGAGVTLAQLQTIPGCSRILHGIYLPYSEQSLLSLLAKEGREYAAKPHFKAVSAEVAEMMALRARLLTKDREAVGIGITGALTTNRYRKGDNGGYVAVCMSKNGEVKTFCTSFSLPKLPEAEYNQLNVDAVNNLRLLEDCQVSELVCNAILGKNEELYGKLLSEIVGRSNQALLGDARQINS